jgi:RNA polymerase sigma-70 factor (ECF subfamily)
MLRRFHDLVEEHQHRVFTFACYYLGNHEEAEDVTQEVLLRLWRNIERVEPETAGAWLVKVTRNACYDALRGRRSRGRVFQEGVEGAAEEAGDPTARPEAALLAWDVARHLRRALAALPDPYRTIAILREVQGKSYQEIAEALDMPLNTVKTYLHRARRRLRELMQEVHCYAPAS